ncbi:MAG: hypothetical protein E7417_06710 [Ruminococcaceae bacterium]|nr:hypothetical protein [Oscillospiraceae bacterium]
MSMENDMTAKIYGELLAQGMSLADCNLEKEIESDSLAKLKEIKQVVTSDENDKKKLAQVERILAK